ncbi:MAG TPA: FUSC family protein [Alphaproteobacteria bacterium]
MITADAEAALFSLKSFAAAIIAYYIALRIGFAQPVWAITTAYIVSQPLAATVLSKALFRILGTFLGAAAAVVFVPAFVNEPLALSFVLALWLGLCVYIAQLDRTPRSYVFLLAGYTASIVGFPSVLTPGNIFNVAVLRVQEIGIGIVVASVVHAAILPRSITKRLQQQIKGIVGSVEQWSRQSLAGSRDAVLDRERRRLASNVNDIEQLSFHLAYDTARLLPPAAAVRALQDELCWLLPVSDAVEDRIANCIAQEGGLPTDVGRLVARVEEWLAQDVSGPARDDTARELIAEAEGLGQALGAERVWRWREMLLASLLGRLADLVRAHRLLRELHDRIMSGSIRGLSPEAAELIKSTTGRSLHRDHGLALRSALGVMVAVCSVCAFWIATAWPSGATAALIVGVGCALFGTLPNPGFAIRRFFYGLLASVAVATAFGFVILPRVTDFVMLAAVFAPLLLLIGSLMTRPPLSPFAFGGVVGFLNTVGIASTYQSDFASFINGALGFVVGTFAAVIIIDMFHVIGAEFAFARLVRAGFRDIAARADGRAADTRRWMARMVDCIALIAARSGPTGVHPALPHYDAFVGLRIGNSAGELRAFSSGLADREERKAIDEALTGISTYYRSISPAKHVPAGNAVLEAIDRAMAMFASDPQPERRRQAVIRLTGLRRSLFPHAAPFAGAPA